MHVPEWGHLVSQWTRVHVRVSIYWERRMWLRKLNSDSISVLSAPGVPGLDGRSRLEMGEIGRLLHKLNSYGYQCAIHCRNTCTLQSTLPPNSRPNLQFANPPSRWALEAQDTANVHGSIRCKRMRSECQPEGRLMASPACEAWSEVHEPT
jgi:hypothetical protein